MESLIGLRRNQHPPTPRQVLGGLRQDANERGPLNHDVLVPLRAPEDVPTTFETLEVVVMLKPAAS